MYFDFTWLSFLITLILIGALMGAVQGTCAYLILAERKISAWAQEKEAALKDSLEKEEAEKAQKKAEKTEKVEEKAAQKTSSSRKTDSAMDRFTKNVMSAVGREAGRILMRGITGMLTGKK